MNQQAFYRNTAIGHLYTDENGFLKYWSWGERRRTLKAQHHYHKPWRLEGLEAFCDDSIAKNYKPPGMTYEERFGKK